MPTGDVMDDTDLIAKIGRKRWVKCDINDRVFVSCMAWNSIMGSILQQSSFQKFAKIK